MTKQDQLAEFLRNKGVTLCPPSTSFQDQAKPLVLARLAHERTLTQGEDNTLDGEVIEREKAAETRYLELQGIYG